MDLIPMEVVGLHVVAEGQAPVVLLRESSEPHRVLPIFVGGTEAIAIALGLGDDVPPRPMTHDLMVSVLEAGDTQLDDIAVTELHDGTFYAELHVTGPHGPGVISSRPSDAIALAVRLGAPVLANREVLDEAGGIMLAADEDESEDIEAEVDRFRDFLGDVDPEAFADGPDLGDDANGDPEPD